MRPLSSLPDSAGVIVGDTSTAINLNATRCAADILRALPHKVVIERTVFEELETGRLRGREDADMTASLVSAGLIEIVSLGEAGLGHFEALVVGAASDTLDDGEAATIAYGLEAGAMPLIDERKAHRICAERFPSLRVGSTVDLLAHASVEKVLGRDGLVEALLQALLGARMRVMAPHIEWVINIIGPARAAQCASLPRQARMLVGKEGG